MKCHCKTTTTKSSLYFRYRIMFEWYIVNISQAHSHVDHMRALTLNQIRSHLIILHFHAFQNKCNANNELTNKQKKNPKKLRNDCVCKCKFVSKIFSECAFFYLFLSFSLYTVLSSRCLITLRCRIYVTCFIFVSKARTQY